DSQPPKRDGPEDPLDRRRIDRDGRGRGGGAEPEGLARVAHAAEPSGGAARLLLSRQPGGSPPLRGRGAAGAGAGELGAEAPAGLVAVHAAGGEAVPGAARAAVLRRVRRAADRDEPGPAD